MSSATSTPIKAPKSMSSRLLTMKFMQRAAASSPVSSPSTPDLPSAKRQKVEDSSPLAFDVNALADQRAVAAALANEEALREALLDRQAAEAGDTRWVLNFEQQAKPVTSQQKTPLRVIQAGFAAIDRGVVSKIEYDDEETPDRAVIVGRRSFGKFNRKLEKLQNPDAEDSSDSGSKDDDNSASDSNHSDDDDDPTSVLVKEARQEAAQKLKDERKAKRKSEKAESIRLADIRKNKNIQLNTLKSISGPESKRCYECGEDGHTKQNCPKLRKGDNRKGGPKKSRKSA